MNRLALPLVLLWLGAVQARADEAGTAGAGSARAREAHPQSSFFPSGREQDWARSQERARDLERLLSALSGVVQARVVVSHPDPTLVPLDAPVPPARLTVLLQVSDSGPPPSELSAVLGSVRASETPAPIVDVIQTRSRFGSQLKPTLSSIGEPDHRPAHTHETKGSLLRTLLAISLAANVLLATVLLLRGYARGSMVRNSANRSQ
jgi:hypothetical protein